MELIKNMYYSKGSYYVKVQEAGRDGLIVALGKDNRHITDIEADMQIAYTMAQEKGVGLSLMLYFLGYKTGEYIDWCS